MKNSPQAISTDRNIDLCSAAVGGKLEEVSDILSCGVDPNLARDCENRTALFSAISEGHDEVALFLIDYPGIDVSIGRSCCGGEVTPLCAAAHEGLVSVISALLKRANEGGEHGTPLVNRAMPDGRTPLMLALSENHQEATKVLLEDEKCDPNMKDKKGCSAAWAAAEAGACEALEVLLSHAQLDINEADDHGRTPIWIAAALGNAEVVHVLSENHLTDLNQADSDGLSPLHVAASRGHTGVLSILLEHANFRLDPNRLSTKNNTALGLAIGMGHAQAVRVMLSCDFVECNAPIEDGGTALGVAALTGKCDVVKELLSCNRVDPCAADQAGRTPLQILDDALVANLGELGEMQLKPRFEEVQSMLQAAIK